MPRSGLTPRLHERRSHVLGVASVGRRTTDTSTGRKGVSRMAVNVRVRDKDPLAVFLGWFSIGLGTAQLAAPRLLCKLVGANTDGRAPKVMRLLGARELTQGAGILVRPRPTMWVWSRVAGDGIDLALLGVTAA